MMLDRINPFVAGPPIISPSNFYGREDIARRFFEVVVGGNQMMPLSLLGAAGSGKTSFLNYVRNSQISHSYLGQKMESILFIYIESKACGNCPEEFYELLMRETNRSVANRLSANSNKNKETKREIHCDNFGQVDFFFDDICSKGWKIILLLDNFDALILRKSFDEDFLGKMRSLVVGRDLTWVTTSFRRLAGASNEAKIESTFYSIFYPEPLYIGALLKEDATRLINAEKSNENKEQSFSSEDIEFIIHLAGKMPYPLQSASSILHQAHKNERRERWNEIY